MIQWLALFQESASPVDKALDSRNSAFEAAVSNREKLDFNRNLKEGGKGALQPLRSVKSTSFILAVFSRKRP